MYRRPMLVAALVAVAALATPALTQATTLTPAGDTLDAGTQTAGLVMSGAGGLTRCTADLGAARIPAAPGNHASGSLTVALSSNPAFSGCTNTGGWTVTAAASGAWSATFAWGSPISAALNAPAAGVKVDFSFNGSFLCEATSSAAGSSTGSWVNGFTSPSFTDSTLSASGSLPVTWTGAPGVDVATCQTAFGGSVSLSGTNVPVRDATNPSAVILVGS